MDQEPTATQWRDYLTLYAHGPRPLPDVADEPDPTLADTLANLGFIKVIGDQVHLTDEGARWLGTGAANEHQDDPAAVGAAYDCWANENPIATQRVFASLDEAVAVLTAMHHQPPDGHRGFLPGEFSIRQLSTEDVWDVTDFLTTHAPTPPAPAEHQTATESPPTALPAPLSGAYSSEPVLPNTWGEFAGGPVHVHDDGPTGTALRYMGPDARMDIGGEPLANVVGLAATKVVRGETLAEQFVTDMAVLRDRLPEDSQARQCLARAVADLEGPDTPCPPVPADAPDPLRALVAELHAIPLVRRDPTKELDPLLALLDQRMSRFRLADEVRRLANRRHESLGEAGKFEIDNAVRRAVEALQGR